MAEKLDRTGEKYITNEGYEVEIIEYFNKRNCTIKFLYNGHIMTNIFYHNLKVGGVKNPFHLKKYGVGYFGVGLYKSVDENGKDTKAYTAWGNMLKRCYFEDRSKRNESYKNCIVVAEWQCFQNYAAWVEVNYKVHMNNWVVDKDILFKGNKTYSPETCCFVPQEINLMFVNTEKSKRKHALGVSWHMRDEKFVATVRINGRQKHLGYFTTELEAFQAYKTAKETEIKRVADIYKDQIDSKVYDAMYAYEVLITD